MVAATVRARGHLSPVELHVPDGMRQSDHVLAYGVKRGAREESRGGPINYSDVDADELVPQLAQLVAFIQQRIRHGYRRQRPSEGGGNKLLDVSVPYF
jgi:hypothetical protein